MEPKAQQLCDRFEECMSVNTRLLWRWRWADKRTRRTIAMAWHCGYSFARPHHHVVGEDEFVQQALQTPLRHKVRTA